MCGNLFRKPPTPHTPTVPAATSICICVTTSLVLVWHPVQPILYNKQLASRCLCILRLLLPVCMWPESDVRDQKNYGHTVLRGGKRALLAGKCRPAVCPHTYKCWPHNMPANNTERNRSAYGSRSRNSTQTHERTARSQLPRCLRCILTTHGCLTRSRTMSRNAHALAQCGRLPNALRFLGRE